jgi:hypothetical protein
MADMPDEEENGGFETEGDRRAFSEEAAKAAREAREGRRGARQERREPEERQPPPDRDDEPFPTERES